jgi:hypothetical protein
VGPGRGGGARGGAAGAPAAGGGAAVGQQRVALAECFGADNGRVARIILWTTAAAFFSVSGVVALLG